MRGVEPVLGPLPVGKGGPKRSALQGTPRLVIALAPRVEHAVHGLNEGPVATTIRIGPVNAEAKCPPTPQTHRLADRMFHECNKIDREVEAGTVVHGNAERIVNGPLEPKSPCHKGRGWPVHGRPRRLGRGEP